MHKNLLCAATSSAALISNALGSASYKTLLQGMSALSLQQTRGLRDDLKARGIEWREPKKYKKYHPEISGDLEAFKAADISGPTHKMTYAHAEFEQSSPEVQRLLSLEFAHNNELIKMSKLDILRETQRHQYDSGSLAAKITNLTVSIRYHQTEKGYEKLLRYSERRVHLEHLVDRRKKYLVRLRRIDYKRFEWLLEKLNLLYKSRVLKGGPIYRYDSLRKLVSMRCEKLRKAKLAAYKAKLDAQKESFEAEKKSTLEWIKETEEKLGIPVTVDPETGMIEAPLPPRVTIAKRIFGPYLVNKE